MRRNQKTRLGRSRIRALVLVLVCVEAEEVLEVAGVVAEAGAVAAAEGVVVVVDSRR